MNVVNSDLERQFASRYKLRNVELSHLGTPVNDVVAVTSSAGEFALKLHHRKRTLRAVQWEIDRAADRFAASPARESYDAAALVDDQLRRMRHLLIRAGSWRPAVALAERLKSRLVEPALDRGICHMDLTLDNVHLAEGLTIFDFDSAGMCWRAIEPWGGAQVLDNLLPSLAGRATEQRAPGQLDEAAVAVFGIVLISEWWRES
jgi:Ser/Thr protein kinase RdoA (MazF antagonist)